MKITEKTVERILFVLLTVIIGLLILFFSTGCSPVRKLKSTSDSLYVKSLEDSNRVLRSERDLFEQHYNELLYSSVIFDTVTLRDTINHVNTVYITKEGEIKAEGNIKRVDLSKNVLTKIVNEKDRTIDSLKSLKEKVKVETHEVYKEKKAGFGFIWWLIIGFLGGVVFCYRNKIISFLRA